MMTTTPTPDEKVQASRMLAELHAQGYQDDTTHKLQPGARIRHTGHQYPGAFIHGTGVVLHVTIKPDSPWTDTHHTPDVEVIVLWDRPHLTPSRLATLSSYHVRPAMFIEHGPARWVEDPETGEGAYAATTEDGHPVLPTGAIEGCSCGECENREDFGA